MIPMGQIAKPVCPRIHWRAFPVHATSVALLFEHQCDVNRHFGGMTKSESDDPPRGLAVSAGSQSIRARAVPTLSKSIPMVPGCCCAPNGSNCSGANASGGRSAGISSKPCGQPALHFPNSHGCRPFDFRSPTIAKPPHARSRGPSARRMWHGLTTSARWLS